MNYDEAIRHAIDLKFLPDISKEIYALEERAPIRLSSARYEISVPLSVQVKALYDRGMAAYLVEGRSSDKETRDWYAVRQVFSSRALSSREEYAALDYELNMIRREFLSHFAELELERSKRML